jgi:hypothetical protein
MTIYDDLRPLYKEWSETGSEYWLGSARYAQQFAMGLREYLGAPEWFNEDGKKRPYIEVCKVKEDENGEPHFEPANFHDVMSASSDGSPSLSFGITVVLERAANTFPKGSFGFSMLLTPRGSNTCVLRISGQEFDIDMSNDQTRTPAYDHMLTVIREFLATKPWDANRKRPIGFVHSV